MIRFQQLMLIMVFVFYTVKSLKKKKSVIFKGPYWARQ